MSELEREQSKSPSLREMSWFRPLSHPSRVVDHKTMSQFCHAMDFPGAVAPLEVGNEDAEEIQAARI